MVKFGRNGTIYLKTDRYDILDNILTAKPWKYESRNHFVRVAIEQLIRKEVEDDGTVRTEETNQERYFS